MMKITTTSIVYFLLCCSSSAIAFAADEITVASQKVADPKVVFATVESIDVVSARARIGGTIVTMNVKEGDEVKAGQEIAVVGDDKLALQVKTLEAQISGLVSQSEKANADLKRVQSLMNGGAVSKSTLDSAKATASSAENDLKARRTQRELIEQQMTEGKILSPSNGRVLKVPMTAGTVVMSGETIATIAVDYYILRLRVPERHAQFLKKGDKIRLDGSEMGNDRAVEGEISLVYPAIEDGRVEADAIVPNLDNYFVGERVRVWVTTADRSAYIIPKKFIATRSGIDYVSLKTLDGKTYKVPVQCGASLESDKVEILSAVKDNDILVSP